VGNPAEQGNHIGPLVSAVQFEKVQAMIQAGIDEGATLVAGRVGKSEGFATGYFTQAAIFSDITNEMTITQEEIFGPVLVMIPYEDDADAISIANNSPYGIAAFINSASPEKAQKNARKLRAGMICINVAAHGFNSPFGGFKQSGNSREWGEFGFDNFLETKSISR